MRKRNLVSYDPKENPDYKLTMFAVERILQEVGE